ncbi:MAG: hypothetical protein SOZ83_00640 [Sphaerochaetaceae bacterium]|nr:hypothetical protein [Spirochaetales bacterium]MDY3768101.1 hypothetical protein [Sphaerochaetaceae bacterium]
MVYRCPECGKTHVFARLIGYTCKKDLYKAHDCLRYFLKDESKKPLHEYEFYDRAGECYICDFRGEPVFEYVCKDCRKRFPTVEIYLNESTADDGNTTKTQNAFVLKNEDIVPTPEGE